VSAILSPCGQYRPRLDREIQAEGITVLLVGVNPSTADATVNDATIRKDMGFGRRLGWARIMKGNVFDWRATDVGELARVPRPVSAANLAHLARMGAEADLIVPCWGRRDKVPRALHYQIDFTLEFLRALGKPLKCFGLTAGGDPLHTLMLGYDTPLVDLPQG
jgi:hypothetical protein